MEDNIIELRDKLTFEFDENLQHLWNAHFFKLCAEDKRNNRNRSDADRALATQDIIIDYLKEQIQLT